MAGVATLAVVIAGCGSSGSSSASGSGGGNGAGASVQSASFQQYPASSNNWIPYIAQTEGFFQKNGISAKFVTTDSGPQTTAAVAAGSIDLGQLDLTLAGPYIAKGTPFQVAFASNLSNWSIVANKKSPLAKDAGNLAALLPDLAGKNLGVIGLGSSSYYYMRALVAAGGVSPDKATYTATGSNVATVATLQGNRTDAAVVDPSGQWPLIHADNSCCITLFDFANPPKGISSYSNLQALTASPSGAYWGTTKWIGSHPTALSAVQKSIAEADVWMHNPANIGKLVTDLSKYGLPKTVPSSEYQQFVQALLPIQESYFSQTSTQTQVNFVKSSGIVKSSLDPASLLAPGVPESAAAVKQLAAGS